MAYCSGGGADDLGEAGNLSRRPVPFSVGLVAVPKPHGGRGARIIVYHAASAALPDVGESVVLQEAKA